MSTTTEEKVGSKVAGGDGIYMQTTPIAVQFKKALEESKGLDTDLGSVVDRLHGKVNKPGKEVAGDVEEAFFGKNGDVPYFVEALAPYLGFDANKIDPAKSAEHLAKYFVPRHQLKTLVDGQQKFNLNTILQLGEQSGRTFFRDITQTIPIQLANYKNLDEAARILIEMQRYVRGQPAADNLRQVLYSKPLTAEIIQSNAAGVLEGVYEAYKATTAHLSASKAARNN